MTKRRGSAATKLNGQQSSDGLPADEIFQRHLDKIRPAVGKLAKINESARRQRAIVSDLYDRANKDGCNRKGFVNAIALMAKASAQDGRSWIEVDSISTRSRLEVVSKSSRS